MSAFSFYSGSNVLLGDIACSGDTKQAWCLEVLLWAPWGHGGRSLHLVQAEKLALGRLPMRVKIWLGEWKTGLGEWNFVYSVGYIRHYPVWVSAKKLSFPACCDIPNEFYLIFEGGEIIPSH